MAREQLDTADARTRAVKVLESGDEAGAVSTIVLAFADDPVPRWFWPQAGQYLAGMPALVHVFAAASFAGKSAYGIAGVCGVALWMPPGAHPDEDALAAALKRTVAPSAVDAVFAFFGQMEQHRPKEPCWYLPLIGVDPACRGRGYGSELLAHALARCDREGLPAYLEATNTRNIPLYERHGFEVTGSIQAGSSPVLTPMLRRPRR
jgi:GNAT superfamily N-acetyltransferase